MFRFIAVCGVVIFIVWALSKAFRILNSPDGERYQRMRAQGPFVPLSAEEIEEDRKRSERNV